MSINLSTHQISNNCSSLEVDTRLTKTCFYSKNISEARSSKKIYCSAEFCKSSSFVNAFKQSLFFNLLLTIYRSWNLKTLKDPFKILLILMKCFEKHFLLWIRCYFVNFGSTKLMKRIKTDTASRLRRIMTNDCDFKALISIIRAFVTSAPPYTEMFQWWSLFHMPT